MSYDDAVKLLAFRQHLSDLRAALTLIGFRLAPELDDAEPALDNAKFDDMVHRVKLRVLLEDYRQSRARVHDGGTNTSVRRDKPMGWNWGGHRPERSESSDYENAKAIIASIVPRVQRADLIAKRSLEPAPWERQAGQSRPAPETVDDAQVDEAQVDRRIRDELRMKTEVSHLDVVRVVDQLAQLKPLLRLPLLRRTRQAKRVQVVYDIGLLAGPFGDDLRQTVNGIRRLADGVAVDEVAFRHRLRSGCGRGPIWTWRAYRSPRDLTAVVFVSGSFGGDPIERQAEIAAVMAALDRRGHRSACVWFGGVADPALAQRIGWVVAE
jgi:hypothetical protein